MEVLVDGAAMLISAVFITGERVDSGRDFQSRGLRSFE